jgi:hypothetical protein
MSLEVSIALRAEQDMTLQYRWYLENADSDVAERYLLAVHETILGSPSGRAWAALGTFGLPNSQTFAASR